MMCIQYTERLRNEANSFSETISRETFISSFENLEEMSYAPFL